MWIDIALLSHVGDAITTLTEDWVWTEVGDTVDDIVAECKDIVEDFYG